MRASDRVFFNWMHGVKIVQKKRKTQLVFIRLFPLLQCSTVTECLLFNLAQLNKGVRIQCDSMCHLKCETTAKYFYLYQILKYIYIFRLAKTGIYNCILSKRSARCARYNDAHAFVLHNMLMKRACLKGTALNATVIVGRSRNDLFSSRFPLNVIRLGSGWSWNPSLYRKLYQ